MPSLHLVFRPNTHVISEVIKAKLTISTIGNIPVIHFFTLLTVHLIEDTTNRQTQIFKQYTHPLTNPFRQIIIYRDYMYAPSGDRIENNWHGRNQGFTLSSFHFSNFTLMEYNAPHQLDIKWHHLPFHFLMHNHKLSSAYSSASIFNNGKNFWHF